MSFSTTQYSTKSIFIILIVLLVFLGIGAAAFFFWQSRLPVQTAAPLQQSTTGVQIKNTPLFLSLESIQPLISTCKFVNYKACVEKTGDEKSFAGQTYEVFAQDDIFYWLNKQQKSPLRNL